MLFVFDLIYWHLTHNVLLEVPLYSHGRIRMKKQLTRTCFPEALYFLGDKCCFDLVGLPTQRMFACTIPVASKDKVLGL